MVEFIKIPALLKNLRNTDMRNAEKALATIDKTAPAKIGVNVTASQLNSAEKGTVLHFLKNALAERGITPVAVASEDLENNHVAILSAFSASVSSINSPDYVKRRLQVQDAVNAKNEYLKSVVKAHGLTHVVSDVPILLH